MTRPRCGPGRAPCDLLSDGQAQYSREASSQIDSERLQQKPAMARVLLVSMLATACVAFQMPAAPVRATGLRRSTVTMAATQQKKLTDKEKAELYWEGDWVRFPVWCFFFLFCHHAHRRHSKTSGALPRSAPTADTCTTRSSSEDVTSRSKRTASNAPSALGRAGAFAASDCAVGSGWDATRNA